MSIVNRSLGNLRVISLKGAPKSWYVPTSICHHKNHFEKCLITLLEHNYRKISPIDPTSGFVTSHFAYRAAFLRHIHFSNNVSIFFQKFQGPHWL